MSPRTTKQVGQIRTLRRKEILDAALLLFGNNGFAQTSISAIAKEAGISKGLIYNYFESKDALLEGVVMRASDEALTLYADAIQIKDPKELLQTLIEQTVDYIRKKREYNALLISMSLQKATHVFIQDFAQKKINEMLPFFEGLLEQIGFTNSQDEVYLFGAAMDGMTLHYLTSENEELLDKTAAAIIKRYIK
ncbi:MAG: AcrR family transcriptional regulator [Arcticibacterium sp.]|jgi:AcrR family transcriptional regulator